MDFTDALVSSDNYLYKHNALIKYVITLKSQLSFSYLYTFLGTGIFVVFACP